MHQFHHFVQDNIKVYVYKCKMCLFVCDKQKEMLGTAMHLSLAAILALFCFEGVKGWGKPRPIDFSSVGKMGQSIRDVIANLSK